MSALLSQVTVYPIKSTSGIHLNHAFVEEKGLAFDRRFVLTDKQGVFITARTQPKLTLIHSAITEDGLHLKAPEMPALDIVKSDFGGMYTSVEVWGDKFKGLWCHKNYDLWFSEFLGVDCRLLYFGEHSQRQVKDLDSQVGFADGYPLLIISQASLDDLNARVSSSVSMDQFRPNLVVKDCDAFAEDTWKRIRIGGVEFEVVKPCSRCIFTTIDPKTAEKHADQEPLVTLQKYRKGSSGEVYFGQNLVALNEGKISLYDSVEVLEYQTPEAYPDHAPKVISHHVAPGSWPENEEKLLTCIDIKNETADVKTFYFTTKPAMRFNYLAGQYLPLEFEIDGKPVHRNYTLSSSPSRPDLLSITVKRVEGGLVSNWLHDNFKVGHRVKALTPDGDFHCFAGDKDKLLMLSAGSGITPMLSMLKWMTDNRIDKELVFFHSAHREADLIARQELEHLAVMHGRCDVFYTLTQDAAQNWSGYQGRLNKTMLTAIPDLLSRSVYVCGPHPFMVAAKDMLTELGLPEDQYFEESFGARDLVEEELKAVNLLFDSWDTYIKGDNQTTILEQAEKAGLRLPFSCRGGMCGACKVKLESGEVKVLNDAALSLEEKEQGYILACSCKPESDLVISAG